MGKVISYIIGAKGCNHTRREYMDGEPVKFGVEKKGDRRTQFVRYGYGDVIKIDSESAKHPSLAHLKLSLHIGKGDSVKTSVKPSSDEGGAESELPKGWRDFSKNEVRKLAAKLTDSKFNELNYEQAFELLENYESEESEESDAGVIND